MKRLLLGLAVLILLATPLVFLFHEGDAQSETVGLLTVVNAGVELKRGGTDSWVPVNMESIVAGGDSIRTTATGEATIKFFSGGATVTLFSDTEISITSLTISDNSFSGSIKVITGNTHQEIVANEAADSTFEVQTPNLNILADDSSFDLAVEAEGQTNVVATSGTVFVVSNGIVTEVDAGNGLRADTTSGLSTVLPVTSLDQLDVALNGVQATFIAGADVQLNVRRGPSRVATLLGTIVPGSIQRVFGISADGNWYRIPYQRGYGWVSGTALTVTVDNTLLIQFANDYEEPAPATQTVVQQSGSSNQATSVPSTTTTTTTGSIPLTQHPHLTEYSRDELDLIAAINDWRISVGTWPLEPNATLTNMARDQASYVVSLPSDPADIHADAKGRNPRQRAVSSEYAWPYYSNSERVNIGENAYAGANLNRALEYWRNSDIHRNALENAGYREIGVAVMPHRYGKIYLVVFGSRPNIFPVLRDPIQNVLYIPVERYRFATGGDWVDNVQQVQFLDGVLSQLQDSAWETWTITHTAPGDQPFALAFRGNGEQTIMQVDPRLDIAWLPGNLPPATTSQSTTTTSSSQQIASSPAVPTAFPTNTPIP